METIESIESVAKHVGRQIGPGDWVTVTQKMIDSFAEATGDRQWIHCDPKRALHEMPGGKTIAHGYLTLALLARLQNALYEVRGVTRAVNGGANRLRFITPVPVDCRVRLRQIIRAVEPIPGGIRIISESTFEIENETKPALIVETVGLLFD